MKSFSHEVIESLSHLVMLETLGQYFVPKLQLVNIFL